MFPGLRQLVDALVNAIPSLAKVFFLLAFIFAIFGILGVQIWMGVQHGKCRSTPYPVVLPPGVPYANITADYITEVIRNSSAYRCIDADLETSSLLQADSPWMIPKHCFWPVVEDDEYLCNPDGSGNHHCRLSNEWCGSNYDQTGLSRFNDSLTMSDATYSEDVNWGITNFDNLAVAFLTIFQSITMEGWVDVMYQIQDTHNPFIAAIFFTLLILFGSLFVLNLTLAVIWENFHIDVNDEELIADAIAEAAVGADPGQAKEKENETKGGGSSGGGAKVTPSFSDVVMNVKDTVLGGGETKHDASGSGGTAGSGDGARVDVENPLNQTRSKAGLSISVAAEEDVSGDDVQNKRQPCSSHIHDATAFETAKQHRLRRGKTFSGAQAAEMFGDEENERDGTCLAEPGCSTKCRHSCRACGARLSTKVFPFITHQATTWFVTVLILMNTIVLAMDQHPIESDLELQLEIINFILTIAFAIECTLLLIAYGVKEYFQDRMRQFDFFIVAISIIEMMALPPSFATGVKAGAGGLSALRAFRILRVFRLAKKWKSFSMLLAVIADTLKNVAYFGVLLFLFMYIAALVGMQFFATKMHFDEKGRVVAFGEPGWDTATVPRSNFDSLLWALVTVFQILSGENWNVAMYDGMRATNWVASLYFVWIIVVGNLILLNLFLAIMLSSFDGEAMKEAGNEKAEAELELKKKQEQEEKAASKLKNTLERNKEKIPGLAKFFATQRRIKEEEEAKQKALQDAAQTKVQRCTSIVLTNRSLWVLPPQQQPRKFVTSIVTAPWFDNFILFLILVSSVNLAIDNPLDDPDMPKSIYLKYMDVIMTWCFVLEMILKIISMGFILRPFPHAYLHTGWNILDFVIVIISILGIVPFLSGQEGQGNDPFSSLRSLRTLRALRPLRMISRAPGLRLIVNALLASIPPIINILLICVLFFMIFGIVAISYFKGTFNACQGDAFDALSADMSNLLIYPQPWDKLSVAQHAYFNASELHNSTWNMGVSSSIESGRVPPLAPTLNGTCLSMFGFNASATYTSGLMVSTLTAATTPTSKQLCECWGCDWSPTLYQNFDNILSALSTLWEMSTTEGWVDIMYAACDNRGVDMQPVENYQEGWSVFFVLFIVVGSFFFINLFIGLVIENFNKMKEQGDGSRSLFTTEDQMAWIRTQELLAKLHPFIKVKPPSNRWRRKAFDLSHDDRFDIGIMACIGLNMVVMGMTYFGQSDAYTLFLEVVNYFFALVFTIEAVIKLSGLGKAYFFDAWNIFDFLIVLGTNLGLIVQWSSTGGGSSNFSSVTTVIRTFRVGRIFRLVKRAKRLRQLFNTLLLTLPALGNIGGLLLLVIFMFTVMGVQNFAKVALQGDLNVHANFQDFPTGENWNGLMYSLTTGGGNMQDGVCTDDPAFNKTVCGFQGSNQTTCVPLQGCGKVGAIPYFFCYVLVVGYVMLNLFVAVILGGFGESDEEALHLTPMQSENFCNAWADIDPEGTQLISIHSLRPLLMNLSPPLGFGEGYEGMVTEKGLKGYIEALDIQVDEKNRVAFINVISKLAERGIRELFSLDEETKMELKMELFPARLVKPLKDAKMTCSTATTTKIIGMQKKWRQKVQRRRKRREAAEAWAGGRVLGRSADYDPAKDPSFLRRLNMGYDQGEEATHGSLVSLWITHHDGKAGDTTKEDAFL